MNHRRRIFLISVIVFILVIASIVYEWTRKPHISIPTIGDVKSIQVVLNTPNPNPKPILPDTPQHKTEMTKLLNWLSSAKSVGYDESHGQPSLGATVSDKLCFRTLFP